MFKALSKLFGVSKKAGKGNKETQHQIGLSIEKFNHRTINTFLTTQVIDSTPDDGLLQVVFDNLIQQLPKDYTREYATVTSWTEPQQAIYMIWCLEAEINNGGYNQFYFNSIGQYCKLLPAALRLAGADKFAVLMEKANNTYEQQQDKITRHQDGTLKGFSKSYEDNPLNEYDDEFYGLYATEDLQQLQVEYIRKNKTTFVNG